MNITAVPTTHLHYKIEACKHVTFGKKEVMLVAWQLVRQYNQTFRAALKEAWNGLHNKNIDFYHLLAKVIKRLRLEALKDWDLQLPQAANNMGQRIQITFNNWFFNEKYNVLY